MNKKLIAVAATVVSATALTGVLFMPAQGDFDLNSLNAQVQNHEARITNAEKDIQQLQGATNTAPATDRVSVPSSTVSPPTTTQPAPAPTTQVAQPAPAPAAPSQHIGFICSNTGQTVTDPNDCTPGTSAVVSN